jgi:hypothetical protein
MPQSSSRMKCKDVTWMGGIDPDVGSAGFLNREQRHDHIEGNALHRSRRDLPVLSLPPAGSGPTDLLSDSVVRT